MTLSHISESLKCISEYEGFEESDIIIIKKAFRVQFHAFRVLRKLILFLKRKVIPFNLSF